MSTVMLPNLGYLQSLTNGNKNEVVLRRSDLSHIKKVWLERLDSVAPQIWRESELDWILSPSIVFAPLKMARKLSKLQYSYLENKILFTVSLTFSWGVNKVFESHPPSPCILSDTKKASCFCLSFLFVSGHRRLGFKSRFSH